ncbi:TPR-like protein [Periconia macrospinosa]|uniref:TPR-like protein n=1 Tax=Periconia macrospinosa TaxID=97972 RepID=A0A2V1DLD1_9PLEO|nr:TPR-like protein [Periconia macrospinosa]
MDNKDLWHGLFAAACEASAAAARMLGKWVGDVASSELAFSQAMRLLRSYSLIEEVEEAESYATHPVVHRWAHHSQGEQFATKLGQMAVVVVGWAVPHSSTRDYTTVQRRLLPHAQAGLQWVIASRTDQSIGRGGDYDKDVDRGEEMETVLDAIHLLGLLYYNQGKLDKAEPMYERALQGFEEALGPKHTLTLGTVNNLGNLYADQGKLVEAEQMYERALRGYEKALGPKHTSTLDTVNNLGLLYADQGKLVEAEQMYEWALEGYKQTLDGDMIQRCQPALTTMENMGDLYVEQRQYSKALAMYAKALSGCQGLFGQSSTRCSKLASKMRALPSPEAERRKPVHSLAVPEASSSRQEEKKGSKLGIRQRLKKILN